ncbi:MarR family winged helix-turn-helix transcriptional regulator [Janthinobacterium agaricidamnosum]|uniref:Transcriptional regulator OhrR n=1 Tax=Janthinobacterium agaricidamnosum NBRC 102515 = DSM 9628 TaxID=1349767 RepID=W0VDN5_9BURK|nr:MarR family transcriptional regulator [Janthinobacterium agaricidamnosum]CDG86026.1 transcriptional regulator OhrR [Janthinobacterium agaricidamnosum NBRC 102515 = DSM 9628]
MATSNAPPPSSLDHKLCFQLYATSLKMTQLYKPMLSALNLTYPQYLVMVVLWEQEGLGIKDLAERLQQDSGSITPLVKRLEAEGYLLRSRDPRDERNRVLTLTDSGRQLRHAIVSVDQTIVDNCAVIGKEFEAMMEGLRKLNVQLGS